MLSVLLLEDTRICLVDVPAQVIALVKVLVVLNVNCIQLGPVMLRAPNVLPPSKNLKAPALVLAPTVTVA